MTSESAGGSARARAHDLRARAARLEQQADKWEQGAEGEQRTRAVLTTLEGQGYVVLDDLAIPGSKANIDHVVVGPTGVFVIDSKNFTGGVRIYDGALWRGRF